MTRGADRSEMPGHKAVLISMVAGEDFVIGA
jgi:hypothetical protein